jgi:hypothetical protein
MKLFRAIDWFPWKTRNIRGFYWHNRAAPNRISALLVRLFLFPEQAGRGCKTSTQAHDSSKKISSALHIEVPL